MYTFCYVVIALMTLFGNILTIAAYIVDPRIRENVANTYILNLSVSDLLVAIFIMGFKACLLLIGSYSLTSSYWPFSNISCQIWIFMESTFLYSSVWTVLIISGDRLLLVNDALFYQTRQSHKRAGIIVAMCWIVSILYTALVTVLRLTVFSD